MADLFLLDPADPAEPESTPQVALPDAREREQALDIRHSWIVEAPAGSGKTGLLIQRYLKLLGSPETGDSVESPEQVLAITFTRKATAEMRERVLAQLQAAQDGTEPGNPFDRETRPLAQSVLERDRALNWSLLEQPNRLNIRTIDSICSDIASSLPLLSGSGGRRTTVDDAGPLYATAARRTLMQLGGEDAELHGALHTVLLHRDGNFAECERLLAQMLEFREQWGELVPLGRQNLDDAWLDANVLPRLQLALEQAICSALTQLARTIPAAALSQLTTAAAEMGHIEGYKGAPSPIAICAGRHASPKATVEDLAHWSALIHLLISPSSRTWRKRHSRSDVKFQISKPESAELLSIVQSLQHRDDLLAAISRLGVLPPAKYPQEQWVVAKALFRILNRALAELQLVFAERGECDFAELALAARTALRHDDGTRDLESASSIHFQHLLVDEMQDTSSSQYELIQMLTQGWDGYSQTVFLVGDPKQSIYLFRQARVERFLRTMRSGLLGDLPLGCLRLTANFRSQGAIVADFNADFEQIFPSVTNAQHPEEVPFVSASPIRPADASMGGRIWHANILPDSGAPDAAASKKRQRRSDAAEIRTIVEYWLAKPLPPKRSEPWKIAVLIRSRNHLDEIVAEFKDASTGTPIPFRAVDIEALSERPEVQDLFALTRALLHPADRVAWLAILHAPWCGLSLADLHTLTGGDNPDLSQSTIWQLVADRGDLLPDDACLRLQRIWPVLEAATVAAGRLPLAQTVERTWRSLGGDAYLTDSERNNAHRYLQLLDSIEAEPEAGSSSFDLATLERRLAKLYAAPVIHPGAVDLLTVHKAKGLEWDVVIVPALERIAASNRSRLLFWLELDSPRQETEDHAAHVLLAPIVGKGEASAELNRWITSVHNAREAAERKRLFYVACTRAREELHLFASPSLTAKGEIKLSPTSLLAAAWPAAEPHFAGVLAASRSQPASPEVVSTPLSLAASAPEQHAHGAEERHALIQRLPIGFDPSTRFVNAHRLPRGNRDDAPSAPRFERPEGSVAARAFGNAVHAFLERIAQQTAAGASATSLLASLPAWTPRITAVLRSEGLPPAMVDRLTQQVTYALEFTLKDPTGLWLVSAHEGGATEYALTAWQQQRSAIRLDRIFRAGPEPLAPGSDHLWIVDYKTTTHGPEGLDAFLAEERARYAPQLEAYATVLAQTEGEPAIRLALYYPMLSKLIWWPALELPSS
jgi:ATP-dependent exoDNAse (exonuclease V) beta subunit